MSIFNKNNLRINKLVKNITLISLITSATFTCIQAADNPRPVNWREISIKVTETFGNNQTRPMRSASVTLDLVDRSKVPVQYNIRLPQKKSSGSRGATFTKMPPSNIVGEYIVTVNPKPSDNSNEYTCKKETKTFAHGTSKSTKQFQFFCQKFDQVNESARQTTGGYDLTVDVKQNAGKRGNGLWVVAYDKNNNRLKWVRTNGTRKATIKNVDPAKGPYRIEIHNLKNDRKALFKGQFNMPKKDATFIADLDSNKTQSSSGNSNSSNGSGNTNDKSCHKVRIQKQEGRRESKISEACQQKDGSWKIAPYQY